MSEFKEALEGLPVYGEGDLDDWYKRHHKTVFKALQQAHDRENVDVEGIKKMLAEFALNQLNLDNDPANVESLAILIACDRWTDHLISNGYLSQGWQPIEEITDEYKCGRLFLIKDSAGHINTVSYDSQDDEFYVSYTGRDGNVVTVMEEVSSCSCCSDWDLVDITNPIGWQPLPQTPESEGEK